MRRQIFVLSIVMVLISLSAAILEPCINGFECEKEYLKCTNLDYIGQPEQYDYSLPSNLGFVCLPYEGEWQ